MKLLHLTVLAAGMFTLAEQPMAAHQLLVNQPVQQELRSVRYSNTALLGEFDDAAASMTEKKSAKESSATKSPALAFVLSMAVPGAGQYYAGSRGVKPFLFLGVDVAAWVLHFKYQGDGDDMTEQFQLFRQQHWRPEDYEQYLLDVYGTTNDDSLKATGTRGFTHSLPADTNDQQYYEQVGKYNQFAWGWDDAVLTVGNVSYVLGTIGSLDPPAFIDQFVPVSSNRTTYETMRNDANTSYDNATRMIYVSLANRVISAFEAMLSVRARNLRSNGETSGGLSSLSVTPRLRSLHAFGDTPYVSVKLSW